MPALRPALSVALLATALVLLVSACRTEPHDRHAAADAEDPHAAHAAAAPMPDAPSPSGPVSFFALSGEWTTQAGSKARLGDLPRRKYTVVTMLYTNCVVSCPRILVDLKRIEAGLSAEELKDVRFLIASIDPARDTPARLTQWASDVQLDTAKFTLLTAPDPSVQVLAKALRVRYGPEPNGEFGHTNRIAVITAEGAVLHWQAGLGEGAKGTIAAIRGE